MGLLPKLRLGMFFDFATLTGGSAHEIWIHRWPLGKTFTRDEGCIV